MSVPAATAAGQARTIGAHAAPPAPLITDAVGTPGGVPIKVGNDVIGAVGVSGAPGGDKDEVCSNAGIAKVASKLK